MNILVADAVSPAAVDVLKAVPEFTVIVSNKNEYQNYLSEAHAILVRSAVKVTKEVLAAAPNLKVVGRAGVGVDNVDIEEATARGVVVMNTPGGNAIAVAEHTVALMLCLARSLHLASESTKSGQWEKKKFLGSEIGDKTLGIVGLGNIGMQVARRARPFGMTVLAYDPFVSSDLARDRGIEMVELDELFRRADYLTLHVALTDETRNLVNAESIAKMKDGVRIVNCARGELVDLDAVDAALASGKIAGVALDVFTKEPPGELPLFRHPNVIATPHIGGSTEEAQELVGIRIAEQVRDFLSDGVVMNAVNMPSVSAEQYARLSPYLKLAERLGKFTAQIASGRLVRVKLTYSGEFGETNSHLIRNAALAGVLNRFLEEKANLINAAQVAKERGFGVGEVRRGRTEFADSVSVLLETEQGEVCAEGAVFPDGTPRLLSVDGIYVESPLDGHMLFIKNADVPGVIGKFGTILGNHGVNIADFSLGRGPAPANGPTEAVAAVRVDSEIPKKALDELEAVQAVRFARTVNLT
ncbi:MAG: phosphoglycerate dehydrogenase [Acidobacteria bacterium]|nr:phosphoglycerate dehydrogenase [Acidobacteriota bacterium]